MGASQSCPQQMTARSRGRLTELKRMDNATGVVASRIELPLLATGGRDNLAVRMRRGGKVHVGDTLGEDGALIGDPWTGFLSERWELGSWHQCEAEGHSLRTPTSWLKM